MGTKGMEKKGDRGREGMGIEQEFGGVREGDGIEGTGSLAARVRRAQAKPWWKWASLATRGFGEAQLGWLSFSLPYSFQNRKK